MNRSMGFLRISWGLSLALTAGILACQSAPPGPSVEADGGKDAPASAPPASAPPPAAEHSAPTRAAPAGKDAVSRATSEACPRICGAAKTKGCSIDTPTCLAACEQMTLESKCQAQMLVTLVCMAGLPPSAWSCGAGGFPELLDGHCEAEQGAVVSCLSR